MAFKFNFLLTKQPIYIKPYTTRPFFVKLNCRDCVYSKQVDNKMVCTLFINIQENAITNVPVEICRSDPNLCDDHGEYFKTKK